MSWIQDLYTTYDNCQFAVGLQTEENEVPLLPICHTTQKAQIEIVLDSEGNFLRASVIPKEIARTIIPCTESSGGRTSGEAPHPLCDKLQYIARDYKEWGGSKNNYFSSYFLQLDSWCRSVFSDPKIFAVLTYVQKGSVIHDLVNYKILIADSEGKLLKSWEKIKDEPIPEIFKATNFQEDSFVRWVVEIPGVEQSKLWQDKVIWKKWIDFYSQSKSEKSLCYVTGLDEYFADQHPAKIRNDGDKAKLISSNDSAGFTFRGRFLTSEQAASVGFEVTQKAHFALRWLVSKQGYTNGDQAIVAWATSGAQIPKPLDDSFSLLGFDNLVSDSPETISTAQEVALQLKHRIAGYGQTLGNTTDVVVMGLDSATPGRLSITYYRKLKGSEFLERLDSWHETCIWRHTYRTVPFFDEKTGKQKRKVLPFVGAPAPKDIAEAAYGQRVDGKLVTATINRILPCIIDGLPIPRDLVESAVRRACNRTGMEEWEWNKTLSIACALYKKYNQKEKYDMALDMDRKTRDYLYGRLLALAESLEEWALTTANEKRETNAARLMQRFAERPYSTWRTIELSLTPYKARLGGKATKRLRMIDDVIASFSSDDFVSDKRLNGEFLLGYHCQREELRNNAEANKETNEKDI